MLSSLHSVSALGEGTKQAPAQEKAYGTLDRALPLGAWRTMGRREERTGGERGLCPRPVGALGGDLCITAAATGGGQTETLRLRKEGSRKCWVEWGQAVARAGVGQRRYCVKGPHSQRQEARTWGCR